MFVIQLRANNREFEKSKFEKIEKLETLNIERSKNSKSEKREGTKKL